MEDQLISRVPKGEASQLITASKRLDPLWGWLL
jgi:hypothetical protein